MKVKTFTAFFKNGYFEASRDANDIRQHSTGENIHFGTNNGANNPFGVNITTPFAP